MKIEPFLTIRITGRTGAPGVFAGLRRGAEVPARIVERINSREAVLDIGGKRVHAEFLKGIPDSGAMTLKLDSAAGGSYIFRLLDPRGKDAFAGHIMDMTIFDMKEIKKNIMFSIGGALAKHPAGIFELNAILLGIHLRFEKKEEGVAGLLNRLLKLGVDPKVVSDLSMLLARINVNSKPVQSLLMLLGFGEDRVRRWASGQESTMVDLMAALGRDIKSIDDAGEKETVIRQLMALLKGTAGESSSRVAGEFAYPDGDEYHPVRYLGAGKAWLFSVDFSKIGQIDIVARESRAGFTLSIFSADNNVIERLNEKREELDGILANIHANYYINFYNTGHALNKIVEINSYNSLNSVFDIKV